MNDYEMIMLGLVTVCAFFSYKRGVRYGQTKQNLISKCSKVAEYSMQIGIEYGQYLKERELTETEANEEVLDEMLLAAAENFSKVVHHIDKVVSE